MSQKVSVKVNIGSTSTQPTPEPSPVKEPAPKKKFKLNGIQIGAICFVVLFAIGYFPQLVTFLPKMLGMM